MVRVVQMFPPISVRSFQIASGDKLSFPKMTMLFGIKLIRIGGVRVYLDCTRHPSY